MIELWQKELKGEILTSLYQVLHETCLREDGEKTPVRLSAFLKEYSVSSAEYWRSLDIAAGLLTQRFVGMGLDPLLQNRRLDTTIAEVLKFADDTCPMKQFRPVVPKDEKDLARVVELIRAVVQRIVKKSH